MTQSSFKKSLQIGATLALVVGTWLPCKAQELKGKKALYINSYNEGYSWSDVEQKTILSVLGAAGVEVKTILMDTNRQKSPEHLIEASDECKKVIDQWQPDVVVVSDDSPMKKVWPAYKDGKIPFVFCGVNWDASAYGVPAKNITGMLEVCPVKDLLVEMNKIKPGKTVGFLAADNSTPRVDAENLVKILGIDVQMIFAKDLAAWKQGFLDLQSKVDLLVMGTNGGISDWDNAEASKFAEENTKVVTGSYHDFLNGVALISFNKLAEEQGGWAANAAIKILKGTEAGSIPVVKNVKGELVVNTRIAAKSGFVPSFEVLHNAKLIK